MNNLQVLENGLIPIYSNEQSEVLVDSRELHEFLESGWKFSDWIKDKIEKYSFINGEDFFVISGKSTGGRPQTDYILKLDIAKEIAMVENNEKGRQVRRYFIEAEKRLKASKIDYSKLSPELRMFANVFNSLAKIELEQNQTKQLAEKAMQETKDIKDAIIIESDNWRKDVVRKLRTIGFKTGNYDEFAKESYRTLEEKAGCSLKRRLEHMRERALLAGSSKSRVDSFNFLDVIDEDKKLKEIYIGIINKLYIKYK